MKRREFIALARQRSCGVADRSEGAAADQAADDWLLGYGLAVKLALVDRCIRGAAARTRLDRGPHRCDRVSMGRGAS